MTSGGRTRRVLATAVVAIAVAAGCGVAAWAAQGRRGDPQGPPAPQITQSPSDPTTSANATFAFTDADAGVSYECSLDEATWTPCQSPAGYSELEPREHHFGVLAVDAAGDRSLPQTYAWHVTKQIKLPFTVTGSAPGSLLPGAPAQPLPLTLSNPNTQRIYVTDLTVTVTASPAGCPASSNLSITQAKVSDASPIVIPASGSVTLPAQGVAAPTVGLLNLPANQDACQGGNFTFAYSGSAHS